MSMSRADRSGFAAWWWTIDRVALVAMLALIAIGLMLAFAASPAATGGAVDGGRFPLRREADRVRRHRGCVILVFDFDSVVTRDQAVRRHRLRAGADRLRRWCLFTGSEVWAPSAGSISAG